MTPLFRQIAAMQDAPFACRHCIDGEREDGSLCPWCEPRTAENDPELAAWLAEPEPAPEDDYPSPEVKGER